MAVAAAKHDDMAALRGSWRVFLIEMSAKTDLFDEKQAVRRA
jgi:hypothetical protein